MQKFKISALEGTNLSLSHFCSASSCLGAEVSSAKMSRFIFWFWSVFWIAMKKWFKRYHVQWSKNIWANRSN